MYYLYAGDLGIATSSQAVGEAYQSWASKDNRFYCPTSIDTLGEPEFGETLETVLDHIHGESLNTGFPAEGAVEIALEEGPLDAVMSEHDEFISIDPEAAALQEADLLDVLPLAGWPREEGERRRHWLKFPRIVRIAIRRLHMMLGHKPKDVMVQVLRGAKAPREVIDAAIQFNCDACLASEESSRTHPVAAPPKFEFNHEVLIDVLETYDARGERYSWLNIIDHGTCFQACVLVRVGGGQPTSSKCLQKFMSHCVSWAGWPRIVTTDRGLHNRGCFSKALAAHGVVQRFAGLEAPEQLGRCERHGGLVKRCFCRIAKDFSPVGKQALKEAMREVVATKNEFIRHGEFSPQQWVLGKAPRGVGQILDEQEFGDLAVLSQVDGATQFGRRSDMRFAARKAFVHEDCSRRSRAAVLRKAAPIHASYQVVDIVVYRLDREAGKDPTWSSAARIRGEDKTAWLIHQGIPPLHSRD